MEIQLEKSIIDQLSWRGSLAYVSTKMAEGTEATTASLASLVRCQTGVMLEGLKELAVVAPGAVAACSGKSGRGKWRCGLVEAGEGGVVQNLDSDRYRQFVDDLKAYWDFLNPSLSFAMNGNDGRVIQQFLSKHRQWSRGDWRVALNNRMVSVKKFMAAPRSEPLYLWVGRLDQYASGFVDRFGRPVEGTGDKKTDIRERNQQSIAAAIANAHS